MKNFNTKIVKGIIVLLTIFTFSTKAQVQPAGSGTEADPYQIATLDNLLWMSTNSGSWSNGTYFIQTANIDATGTQNWNGGEGFSPIGNNPDNFQGSYDGQDYSINGLYINRPSSYDQGLFGYLSGIVKNVNLTNVNITGYDGVGALVGYSYITTVSNCTSSGYVTGTENRIGGLVGETNGVGTQAYVTNCESSCNVSGGDNVGGLVGLNSRSTISYSSSSGNASGGDNVGGLVGGSASSSTIKNSSGTGSVNGTNNIGGLAGYCSTTAVSNCYSMGSVNGVSHVAGLVGYGHETNIFNCFSTGIVTGTGSYVGGLVGEIYWFASVDNSFWDYETSGIMSSPGGGTGKTTAEMKNVVTFTNETTAGLSHAWDFAGNPNGDTDNNDYWDIDGYNNQGYPYLSYQFTSPLQADFTVSDTIVTLGNTIQFTDLSIGTPTSWEWDFQNDGTIDSYEQNPEWVYAESGIYSVSLRVSDGLYSVFYSKTDYIFVVDCDPTMTLSPNTLDFGINEIAPTQDTLFSWLENTSDCELYINSLFGLQAPYSFDTTNLSGVSLLPGESIDIPVILNKDFAAGTYTDTLIIANSISTNFDFEDGLVAWYPFNGNANDESGNGHNATTQGGVQLSTDRFGNSNSAYDFDGNDDWISAGNWFAYQDFTISVWVKQDAINSSYVDIIDNNHSSVNWAVQYDGNSGNYYFFTNPQGATAFTLPDNQWKHLVFIKDGVSLKTYINGVLQDELTATSPTINYSNPYLNIGRWGGGDRNFNGKIDDIRMYDHGLSEDEVAALYNENNGIEGYPQLIVNAEIVECLPVLTFSPEPIDFGTLEIAVVHDTLPAWVINSSNCTLYIDSLFGLQTPFSIDIANVAGDSLPSGDSLEVPVILNRDNPAGIYVDTLLVSGNNTPDANLIPGLIAYYPFNGNASDESGNANHGTVNGALLDEDRFGNANSAYYFDGVNDYIEIDDSPSLRPTDITLSGWFNFYTVSSEIKSLIGKTAGTAWRDSYTIWRHSSIKGATGNTGEFDELAYTHSTNQNEWYHIAYTYDDAANTHSLYINGTLVKTEDNFVSIGYDSHPLLLGADVENETLSYFFHGLIDDVRIYDRALTENEIETLYYENTGTSISAQVIVRTEITEPASIELNLNVLLEGPFNDNNMNTNLNTKALIPFDQPFNVAPWNYPGTESVAPIPNADVVDWVLVELHDTTDAALVSAETMIGRQAAFLLNDGSVVGLDGDSTKALLVSAPSISNNLFVALYHRNHISVLSANAITKTDGVYVYDFTLSIDQAYGSNQKDIGGVAVMIGGDANADGIVDSSDKSIWAVQSGTSGYKPGDFNLDGEVNNQDKNEVWTNLSGSGVQLPTIAIESISSITQTTVIADAEVTDDGGATVTAMGFCWSQNTNPTLADYYVQVGSGTGFFSTTITGLSPNTEYFLRAYATNSEGTAYGNELGFITVAASSSCPATVSDVDGNTYNTILIGSQCWMAENLRVGTMVTGDQTDNGIIERYCFDNNVNNCSTYGGLYQWDELMQYSTQEGAQGICPDGWHIPSSADWKILEGNADTQYGVGDPEWDNTGARGFDAGDHLKSTSGWNVYIGGTNSSGFTALPGGYRISSGSFLGLESHGCWWTSTLDISGYSKYHYIVGSDDRSWLNSTTNNTGYSVRCIKN